MLIDIIRFEWRYQTRQVTFVIGAALFFILGLFTTVTGYGPANVHVNSPYSITQSVGLLSLLSVFLLAVFCGNAVVRDRELRTEELVFATPVGKLDFLLGRFVGSLVAALTAFSFAPVGMLVALALPVHDASRIGVIEPISYIWALAVMGIPNFVAAAVILFAIATLTRSMLASYVGAVFIYVLYFVGASLAGSPLMAASAPGAAGELSLASLVDPFGLSAFFAQTRFWTPAERNVRQIALSGSFLLNRVGWLVFSAFAWAALYRLFAFRVVGRSRGRGASIEPDVRGESAATPRIVVEPEKGARATWAALVSATKLEARAIFGSVPFLALNLLWAGLAATEIVTDVASGEYGSALIPTTGIVLSTMQQPLSLIASVILIYYSGEIVWRERATSLSAMLDATPAPGAVFVMSKWLGLCALSGAMIATGSLVGLTVQLARGGAAIEPGVLLAFAWFAFVPLALFAAAAVAAHSVCPGRFVGLFILLLVAFYVQRGDVLGLEHHLWRFGALPRVAHTDMNGFGDFVVPFHAYSVLWGAVAALMLVGASLVWRREPGARRRGVVRIVAGATRATKFAAAAFAVIAVASAARVFWNTNVRNSYESADVLLDWKANYEKRWKRIEPLAQPAITRVEAKVGLRPEDRSYRLAGRFVLVNDSNQAIPGLFVAVRREAHVSALSVPGAKLASHDARFGQYRFDFETPLQPGASTELRFDLSFENHGFVEGEPDTTIVANGSWIPSWLCFPTLGYRRSYEIDDARERRERGLPPYAAAAGSQGDLGEIDPLVDDRITFDVTLSTSRDQIAIAPGHLEREWEENGRRMFRYTSDVSVVNRFNFMSARYEVAREQHGNVSVEVYYHPGHDRNVARILRAATDTLDYMQQNFGPYPHRQLKIAEIPSYWNFGGFAQPDTIVLVDKRSFLKDVREGSAIDVVYRRVAHEVAHQWWGLGVAPPNGPGASAIVESLTKYCELMVVGRALGGEQVRDSLVFELDRYLAGRADATAAEPSLDRVGDEAHIYYGKGALVMHAIADLIGEDATNRALRAYYDEARASGRAPTAATLVAGLLGETPENSKAVVRQWLSEVVLYDVSLDSATASRRSDGRWDVAIRVSAAKTNVAADGSESAIAMAEPVTVAVLGKDDDNAKLLVSSRQPIRTGTDELHLVLGEEPGRVVVDPTLCLIDRNRFDNERQVERQAKGQRP